MDRDGSLVEKPWALAEAEIIDALCQRYSCLPSQLMQESSDILYRLQVIAMGQEGAGEKLPKVDPMEQQLANMSSALG